MNETVFLKVYLRKTNGTGQKITINPQVTSKQIYQFTCHLFNLSEKSFDLFYKGQKILDTNQNTMQELRIQNDSIIHIHERAQVYNISPMLELRVFCQGSLYSYQTSKNSTFRDFKYQMVSMLGCHPEDIIVAYLGKVTKDDQALLTNHIKNRDLVSVIIKPRYKVSQRSVSLFKPKMAQSLTFANSEEMDESYQPFSNQRMRKSSMKSSHQSRQLKLEQSKRLLQVIRPKSELTRSNNSFEIPQQSQKPVLVGLNNLPWLSNQRVIQTQSINFDDPEIEQGPQSWSQCSVQLSNKQKTMFYTLQCYQNQNLNSLKKVLKRCENRTDEISVVFGDESSQQMADNGTNILQIARARNTRIIREVTYY